MPELKIVVLGDSIAEGLGVTGQCYADLLRMRLEKTGRQVRLLNLAYTAFQISDSCRLWPEVIAWNPNVVIIAHGNTEAIIRPKRRTLRLLPPQWRRVGRLDPRPYYSQRFPKKLYQQVDSALRWRVQEHLIRKIGGETGMAQKEFECLLQDSLEALLRETEAQVILMTHSGIDERFYPGSLTSLTHFQKSVLEAAAHSSVPGRVQVCDVSQHLHRWSDFFADHFHPNATGHVKIADALAEKVRL